MNKNGSRNALIWDEFCKHAVGGAVGWEVLLEQMKYKCPRTKTERTLLHSMTASVSFFLLLQPGAYLNMVIV